MNFSPQSLRLSSPITSKQNIYKDASTIDQDYLYQRLSAILLTLQAQKQQFQDRLSSQKKELQQKVIGQQQKIKELQNQTETLQQQCRQLRFNYHQRGSVVDYLKKKVTVVEKKFDAQKEQMMSVIKYLQSRNSQLNQIIYELKNKQLQLNQNIFNLQQKYFNLSNEICAKNMFNRQSLKINTKCTGERVSLCAKNNSGSFTPFPISHKYKNDNLNTNPLTNRQSNLNINLNSYAIDDSNNESLEDSSVRQKTVKYENSITRARSQDEIDFAQLNHIISLGGSKQNKSSDLQQFTGKGILINNYGHLSFSDLPGECKVRQSNKQKHNYVSRPKLSLPNHGRYVTQLNTRRTNKEIGTSIQL